MTKPYRCAFCDKTYKDVNNHHCAERKAWEKTLIYQGKQARKTLKEFTDTVMAEAEKSFKTLRRLFKE